MNLAPIVLFVYNRPWHTRQTLEALKKNKLASKSILYIYSDGPKNDASQEDLSKIEEVRRLLKEDNWCGKVQIVERKKNLGLAESVISGVSEIINNHGKVIVLEDDILTSTGFLKFMNDALNQYENNEKVMHISGYMYPHQENLPETFFYNVPLCWGWATWDRAWQYFNKDGLELWKNLIKQNLLNDFDKFGGNYLRSQLAKNINGSLKTWFIKWHASVFIENGYTLFPATSLVNNIGFDNSGEHNAKTALFQHRHLAEMIPVKDLEIKENKIADDAIRDFYKKIISPQKSSLSKTVIKKTLRRKFRNIAFRLLPELRKHIIQSELDGNKDKVFLGKNSKIYPNYRISNSIIGSYSYISENAIINNTVIGKFCSVGPNLLAGWGRHPIKGVSTHPMFYSTKRQNGITLCKANKYDEVLPIIIGNDVFIGMNVTILDGISIGDGAVIGAGAVVSKDIPAYAIAVGCPIKIIGYRFEENTIENLLKLKWWDLNEIDLNIVEKHFFEISNFINELDLKKNDY